MGVGYATSRAAQSEGTMSSLYRSRTKMSFRRHGWEFAEKRQETPVISNSNPLISLVLLSHREFVSDTILVESAALEPVDFIEKNG